MCKLTAIEWALLFSGEDEDKIASYEKRLDGLVQESRDLITNINNRKLTFLTGQMIRIRRLILLVLLRQPLASVEIAFWPPVLMRFSVQSDPFGHAILLPSGTDLTRRLVHQEDFIDLENRIQGDPLEKCGIKGGEVLHVSEAMWRMYRTRIMYLQPTSRKLIE